MSVPSEVAAAWEAVQNYIEDKLMMDGDRSCYACYAFSFSILQNEERTKVAAYVSGDRVYPKEVNSHD